MSNFARALPVTQWVTFCDLNYVPSTAQGHLQTKPPRGVSQFLDLNYALSSAQGNLRTKPPRGVSQFLDLNYALSSAQGNLRTKPPRGELMPRNRHRIVRVKDFN